MSNIFKRTEKLSQSIALINDLELKQLYHLLQLIVTSSLLTTGSSPEISAQETEFLSSFGENVTSGVKYILEKALYSTLNPEKLNHGLIEMGMTENVANIFKTVWEQEGRDMVKRAKDRDMAPQVLTSFSHRLQLHMSEQNLSKLKAPNCLFQFNLKNDSFYSDAQEESLVVEFSQDELYYFFQNLETIQAQLDQLQ